MTVKERSKMMKLLIGKRMRLTLWNGCVFVGDLESISAGVYAQFKNFDFEKKEDWFKEKIATDVFDIRQIEKIRLINTETKNS